MEYSIYDSVGRIFSVGSGPTNIPIEFAAERAVSDNGAAGYLLGRYDMETMYVENGLVIARPVCPAQLQGLTLSGLPSPCQISINGHVYECDDAEAELDFDSPGTYKVVVRAWPYLDKEFSIEKDPA